MRIDGIQIIFLDYLVGYSLKLNQIQFLSSKKDFRTKITTKMVIDSLEILEEIILTLSDNEVEIISNIYFTLSNYEKYKKECRELALKNAKEKADQISKELNIKITGIYFVEELNGDYNSIIDMNDIEFTNVMNGGFTADYGNSPLSLFKTSNQSYSALYSSKVTIKSIVSVIFLFEN